MITFQDFMSIAEARQPISLDARSKIADVADTLGGRGYERDPRERERAERMISSLEKSDKSRGKRELPVGRMARKIQRLVARPQRTGADKEADFARAEIISDTLKDR